MKDGKLEVGDYVYLGRPDLHTIFDKVMITRATKTLAFFDYRGEQVCFTNKLSDNSDLVYLIKKYPIEYSEKNVYGWYAKDNSWDKFIVTTQRRKFIKKVNLNTLTDDEIAAIYEIMKRTEE